MKLNRKGFTLIELLAVIVVLGIILVIAIPKVVDTIENSRKGSFEASVKSYVKAAQQYVAKKEVEGQTVTSGNISDLDMQNKIGWYGIWQSDNGVVTIGVITNNDYVAYNATNDSVISSKLTEPFFVLPTDNSTALSEVGLTLNGTTLTGSYNGTAKNIVIPDGVKIIDTSVFFQKSLKNVIISNTVSDIGGSSFGSNELTNLVLPNNVTTMGSGAFSENQIIDLFILYGARYIGANAFSVNSLVSVTIPSSIDYIGPVAFQNNPTLTTIINKSGFQDFRFILNADYCVANEGKGTNDSFISGTCTKGTQTITITE